MKSLMRAAAILTMVAVPAGFAHASERSAGAASRGYPAGHVIYHASQSGQPTLDSDAQGGNPFATAFIEALSQRDASLSEFTTKLGSLTKRNSGGFQSIAVSPSVLWPDWSISPTRRTGKRVASCLSFRITVRRSHHRCRAHVSMPVGLPGHSSVRVSIRRARWTWTTRIFALHSLRSASSQPMPKRR